MAETTKRINTVFTIKSDEFNRSLSDMNKQIKLTQSELKLAGTKLKEFGNDSKGLTDKQKALESQIKNVSDKMKLYTDSIAQNTEKMNSNKKELEELKKKKDEVNKEYKDAIKLYGEESAKAQELKGKLDGINKEYKEKENQLKNNVNAVNRHNESLIKSETELVKLQGELKRTNKELADSQNHMLKMGKSLQTTGTNLKDAGKHVSDLGGKIMTLSAPVVASGIAIGKMSMDFEKGIANINTLLDDTSNLDGYKNKVIDLSNDTGISIKTMSDGMYQTISSIGDMGKETESMFGIMSKSAKAGGSEVSEAVSLISAGMKGYGSVNKETAEKISDLAFETAKLGVTTFPEMAKSMQPLFPLSSALNLSMEELFGSMATLTGVTGNTSEVSTQLKAVFSNLLKPTKEMGELIKKYGYENSQAMLKSEGLTGVLQILQKESGGQADKLAKLFSSTEALTGVTALCGANFTDFTTKTGAMNNVLGATDKALEKVSSTTGDKFTKAINKFKNSFIESGDKLAPVVESLSDGISSVADSISKMDAETVASVIQLGGMTMALGGVLKVTGSVTSGIGSVVGMAGKLTTKFAESSIGTTGLMGAIGGLTPVLLAGGGAILTVVAGMAAYKEHGELMQENVLKSKEDMSAFERVVASLSGVEVKSREELEKLGLVYKDFNENISDNFKQKVEESSKTLQDFNVYLKEINFDDTFNQEEANNFSSKVDNICNGAIETIKKNQSESSKEMSNMFKLDDNIIDESEQQVIDFLDKNTKTNITKVTELKDEINKIKQKALVEGRTLNDQEIKDVQEKLATIKQIELESLGSNQQEIIFAKTEFAARVKNMDLQSASDLMIEKAKIRDDEKIKISASYDTQIEIMKQKLGEATGEEKTALETQIKKHEKVRDDKLKVQDDLYKSYLEIIQTNNPNLLAEINKFNGEVLTNEDKKNQSQLTRLKETYGGLEGITETGNYNLLNKISGTYVNMTVVVDENTGEIIGMHSTMTEEVGAYSTQIAKSTEEMSKRYTDSLNTVKRNLSECSTATIDSAGQIVSANGTVIGSLQDLKTNADGTKTGILDLNGTPIKVEANTSNAVTNLDEVKKKAESIHGKIYNFIVKATGDISPIFSKLKGGWATGTNYNMESGLYNVNERGWELSSSPTANITEGLSYVPKGTRITNHLQSVSEMKQEVNHEVARQVSYSLNGLASEIGHEIGKVISQSQNGNGNVFNNTVNVQGDNNNKFDVQKAMRELEATLRRQILVSGQKTRIR